IFVIFLGPMILVLWNRTFDIFFGMIQISLYLNLNIFIMRTVKGTHKNSNYCP
ncbi:hypothetical protein HMPREF0555_0615, partial [Leuconostoc mesenteroides subsp. cremoris ATCC 19254]